MLQGHNPEIISVKEHSPACQKTMRILLVEDDRKLATSLTEALSMQRYTVDCVDDGEAGWAQAQALTYDLMLLDVTLPKLDGLQLCQRLRDHGFTGPILMLTARDTSLDKVVGLDSGADAYMVKPFNLQELLAQIRALLRRGSQVQQGFCVGVNFLWTPVVTKSCTDATPFV
jgi:DNA-binding response OmpR family regulator